MAISFRKWWTAFEPGMPSDQSAVLESSPNRTLMAPTVWLCGITDIGTGRNVNQDAFRISCDGRMWVVADGMGGQKSGEIASQISVDTLIESLSRDLDNPGQAPPAPLELRLRRAFSAAHDRVLSRSIREQNCRGMGSALVVGCVEDDVLHVGHAGDSRAYLFRTGELKRLTTDHSAVAAAVRRGDLTWEQARSHPDRNKLCQAVGVNKPFEPEFVILPLLSRDRVLMCSDGVWGLVSDDEIAQVLGSDVSVHQMAQILVNRALAAGGHDNITLVLYEHAGASRDLATSNGTKEQGP
jgi:PPM family protein phosphatase